MRVAPAGERSPISLRAALWLVALVLAAVVLSLEALS